MPSCEWVIDTWLLEIAQQPLDMRSLDALALLQEIKARHRIAVDHGRRILQQYFKHAPGSSHAGQWLRVVLSKSDKTVWRSGNVPSQNRQDLLGGLRFDPSDLIFVGVAAEGPDRIIVSEESDYSDPVKAYLSSRMGVSVLSIEEALLKVKDP